MKSAYRFFNKYLSKDKEFIDKVSQVIGYTPAKASLYKLAFMHKSNSQSINGYKQHNERLEFLGDAILNGIIAEYLFKKYPNGDEGFLTKMRSKIVKRKTLDFIGLRMGLDEIMSYMNATPISKSMLGNALEALIGAVYIENGYQYTRGFVINAILRKFVNVHQLEIIDDNFKSQLLEWCQKNGKEVSYELISKYKFDKRDKFRIAVVVQGSTLAEADDFNKKAAEQIASEKAMHKLGILEAVELSESII